MPLQPGWLATRDISLSLCKMCASVVVVVFSIFWAICVHASACMLDAERPGSQVEAIPTSCGTYNLYLECENGSAVPSA